MSEINSKKDFAVLQENNISKFLLQLLFVANPEKIGVHSDYYQAILPIFKEWQEDVEGNFPEAHKAAIEGGLIEEKDGAFMLSPKGEAQAIRCLSAPLRPRTVGRDSGAINFEKFVESKNAGYLVALMGACVNALSKQHQSGFKPNAAITDAFKSFANSLVSMTETEVEESSIL